MMIETDKTHTHRHLVCWRSTLAGLALSLVTFSGLIALAAAFGGIALSDGTTVARATTFTAFSIVLSTFIAVFAGSFYSGRISRARIDLVGCAQGALLGSLFLLLVLCQGVSAVGSMAKAAGAAIGGAATVGAAAAPNPMVQEIVEDSLGDWKLKADAGTVAKGVAVRLARGDQESAKNYLAYQSSLSAEEVDQKIAAAKAKVDEAMVKAREAAATGLKATGWGVFVYVVLGLSAAVIGGYASVKANERYTLDTHHDEVMRARAVRV